MLDVVRQAPGLHFTIAETFWFAEHRPLWRRFGFAKEEKRDLHPLLGEASERLNQRLRTFSIEVDRRGSYTSGITVRLAAGAEWEDASDEAWACNASRNEFNLTDPGQALLDYIRSSDIDSDFITERSISYRLGLNGRLGCLEPYFHEVIAKARVALRWETQGEKYGQKRMYRLWVDKSASTSLTKPEGLNPRLDVDFQRFTRDDFETARVTIYRAALKAGRAGSELLHIFSISARRELLHCFPTFASRSYSPAEFFSSVALNPAVSLGYDFRPDVAVWKVVLEPKEGWPAAFRAIQEELARPSLQERFGVSDEAARLLSWIESLPEEKKLLGQLTPVIEEAAEKWIGIKCPWSQDNFPVYLQMLIEEINGRTDYALALQPWHDYSRVRTRIRIRRRRTEAQEASESLRQLCISRGVPFDAAKADELINKLLVP